MARNKICFFMPGPKGRKIRVCLPYALEVFDPFKKFPGVSIPRNGDLVRFIADQKIDPKLVQDLIILKTIDNLVQDLSPLTRQKMQVDFSRMFASAPLPDSLKLAFDSAVTAAKDIPQPA